MGAASLHYAIENFGIDAMLDRMQTVFLHCARPASPGTPAGQQ
jgi:hypothetical protein